MSSLALRLATVAVAGLLVAGCGGSSADSKPVAGTLALGGKPLARVTISLVADSGLVLSGSTDDKGAFNVLPAAGQTAAPGSYKVVVVDPNAKVGKKSPRADDPYSADQRESSNPLIPSKFQRADTSTAKVTVEADKPVVIDLPAN